MISAESNRRSPLPLPLVLAVIHILLFTATMVSSGHTASEGNPLFCVDLPMSLPLVARDDNGTMAAVGILLTGWWYLVGHLGKSSWLGKTSRTRSRVCALVVFGICAFDSYGMISELTQMVRSGSHFVAFDYVIYAFAFLLLAGGFVSAGLCAAAALGFNQRES